ncbi:MAG: hypothetical protein ACOY3P_17585 [Planctomycetota bacterium]
MREGEELVDAQGTFRLTGDRVTFLSADGRLRLVVLENLALERVGRVLVAHSQPLRWTVSGVITEYRGVNYVLLRRAVLVTHVPGMEEPL